MTPPDPARRDEDAAEGAAVRTGILATAVAALALLAGGGAYAALRHEPSRLDRVTRCFTVEKGIAAHTEPYWDEIAMSARSGATAVTIETNRVTIALAATPDEAEQLLARYRATVTPARLATRGRLVAVWERPPSPTQLQQLYDCAY